MARITDYVVENLNASVLLIPHAPHYLESRDDKVASQNIYEKAKHKDAINLLHGDYTADELKGVIGKCDMFIGCRMHATIASCSVGIPTIAITYGSKFQGVLGKMMGQQEYLVSVGNMDFEALFKELKLKIDHVWQNRNKISQELCQKARLLQQEVEVYGRLVRKLLDKCSETHH